MTRFMLAILNVLRRVYVCHLIDQLPMLAFPAVHMILKDVYDPSVYFRFQPDLSEDITIDEAKPEKLALLCEDAEQYISSHKAMLDGAVASLMAEKKATQKLEAWLDSTWNELADRIPPLRRIHPLRHSQTS